MLADLRTSSSEYETYGSVVATALAPSSTYPIHCMSGMIPRPRTRKGPPIRPKPPASPPLLPLEEAPPLLDVPPLLQPPLEDEPPPEEPASPQSWTRRIRLELPPLHSRSHRRACGAAVRRRAPDVAAPPELPIPSTPPPAPSPHPGTPQFRHSHWSLPRTASPVISLCPDPDPSGIVPPSAETRAVAWRSSVPTVGGTEK